MIKKNAKPKCIQYSLAAILSVFAFFCPYNLVAMLLFKARSHAQSRSLSFISHSGTRCRAFMMFFFFVETTTVYLQNHEAEQEATESLVRVYVSTFKYKVTIMILFLSRSSRDFG